MDLHNAETADKSKFRWGLLLAWIPLLFFIVPTGIGSLVSINSHRAIGLAAVAGAFAEVLATLGLMALVGSEVAAIVMLLRSLSRSHPMRTVVAILSVCCSGLLLGVAGLFLWLAIRHR